MKRIKYWYWKMKINLLEKKFQKDYDVIFDKTDEVTKIWVNTEGRRVIHTIMDDVYGISFSPKMDDLPNAFYNEL